MKIRAALTVIALLTAAACGSTPGTPTANSEGAAAGGSTAGDAGAASASVADDGGSMGDESATGDDSAADSDADADSGSDAASDSDEGAVDQGGVDQPGADDTDSDDPDAPGDPEFCKQLLAAEKQLDSIDQAFNSGDMASANKALTADMDVFQKLTDSAPSQIKPAMQDILTALSAAQKALGGSAPDPSALSGMANMTGDITALGNYISNNCAAYASEG